jgi:hypothetical protein
VAGVVQLKNAVFVSNLIFSVWIDSIFIGEVNIYFTFQENEPFVYFVPGKGIHLLELKLF